MNHLEETDFELAISNGINRQLAWNRYYKLFWSKEDATSIPVGGTPKWTHIAQESGIALGTYYSRRNTGMSQEEAATKEVTPKNTPSKHTSYIDVAKEHGISKATYYKRLKEGWAKEEASTTPTKGLGRRRTRIYTDEQLEIANQNGISRQTLDGRINKWKWDLKRAITEPPLETWIRNHGDKAQMFVSRKQRPRKKDVV